MKYKAVNGNEINSKNSIILVIFGAALILIGITRDSQILLVFGALAYLLLMIRRPVYVDEKGLVMVTNYRLFKRYKIWEFNEINEITWKEDSFNEECVLSFNKDKEACEYIFESEDADKILKLAKEKNLNINIIKIGEVD